MTLFPAQKSHSWDPPENNNNNKSQKNPPKNKGSLRIPQPNYSFHVNSCLQHCVSLLNHFSEPWIAWHAEKQICICHGKHDFCGCPPGSPGTWQLCVLGRAEPCYCLRNQLAAPPRMDRQAKFQALRDSSTETHYTVMSVKVLQVWTMPWLCTGDSPAFGISCKPTVI